MSQDRESGYQNESPNYNRRRSESNDSRQRSVSNNSRRRSDSNDPSRRNNSRRSSSADSQSQRRSRRDSYSSKQHSPRSDAENHSPSPRRRSEIVSPESRRPSRGDRSLTPLRQERSDRSRSSKAERSPRRNSHSSRRGEDYSGARRNYRSPIKGSPNRCVGVFGLSYDTSRGFFEREFAKFGHVENVNLVCDPCGYSRGFGFVTFERQEDADRAVKDRDDTIFDGKRIHVDYSISRGPHAKSPGQYLGQKSSSYLREGRGGIGIRGGYGGRSSSHREGDYRAQRGYNRNSPQRHEDRHNSSHQDNRRSDHRSREGRSRSPAERYRKERQYSRERSDHYNNSTRRY